jgi:ribosomal protein S18 acetylase RimI-like enzyme
MVSGDRPRLAGLMTARWGSTSVARLRRLTDVTGLEGFVAAGESGEWMGYASYEIDGSSLEILVLESVRENRGVASALIARCVARAIESKLDRVWLITTNDNVDALRFYQRRGFVLVALHRNGVSWSRQNMKPEIPELGFHDIPIRDELELELPRSAWADFVAHFGAYPAT